MVVCALPSGCFVTWLLFLPNSNCSPMKICLNQSQALLGKFCLGSTDSKERERTTKHNKESINKNTTICILYQKLLCTLCAFESSTSLMVMFHHKIQQSTEWWPAQKINYRTTYSFIIPTMMHVPTLVLLLLCWLLLETIACNFLSCSSRDLQQSANDRDSTAPKLRVIAENKVCLWP